MNPFEKLSSLITPSTALDIGANTGGWSTQARKAWPSIEIDMVEANPKCFEYLRSIGFPFHIAALGSEPKNGMVFFMQPRTDTGTGNSFFREKTEFFANPDTIEIDVLTLDGLFPDKSYDLIKIDTQGSELSILRGGQSIVSKAKWLLLEISIESYNEGAPLKDEVEAYLATIGFRHLADIEDICHPIQRHTIQKDILYTR